MRNLIITALVLTAIMSFAEGSHPETLDELKQRASAAKPGDQPKLFLEVAERQLHVARDSYEKDKPENARLALSEMASYCEKAAAAAIQSKKYVKQAEIRVRDMIRSLDALRHTLASDERAPVQAAVDRMEKVRTDLLAAMFGTKA